MRKNRAAGQKHRWIASLLMIAMLTAGFAGCGAGDGGVGAGNGGEIAGAASEKGSEAGRAQEESGQEKASQEESGQDKTAAATNRANADTGEGEIKILAEGDVAPDFTAELVDGTAFKLSDHDDGVVLLNFFATWCGPCVREMPAFDMLLEDDYENLSILCVNCMEQKKTVDTYVSQNGYAFPVAYDEDGRIERYYPTDGIPYTLVINQGVIAKIYLGALDAQTQYKEYKSAIDSCLTGN